MSRPADENNGKNGCYDEGRLFFGISNRDITISSMGNWSPCN